jgi:osmotically-inducible protein OsmY
MNDQEIRRNVESELQWDAEVDAREIGVAVKNGIVTLSGSVERFARKWAAERAALRVGGVKAVANDIEVRLPATDDLSDAAIAERAAQALELDSLVPVDTVKVTVDDRWVTLRGEVDWQYQRREAERVVRALYGVRGVSNLLTIRPRSGPSPDELREKIEDALVRTAETDAERIDVRVDGHQVVLTGTVRSWAERRAAERAAWSAPGVTEVDNQIEIRP